MYFSWFVTEGYNIFVTRPLYLVKSHTLDAPQRRERSLFTSHTFCPNNTCCLPVCINIVHIVICWCRLNNTQVCDEHSFWQVSTCTGCNQLPIFHCTNVHPRRHPRSLIYAQRLRWCHESERAHKNIFWEKTLFKKTTIKFWWNLNDVIYKCLLSRTQRIRVMDTSDIQNIGSVCYSDIIWFLSLFRSSKS